MEEEAAPGAAGMPVIMIDPADPANVQQLSFGLEELNLLKFSRNGKSSYVIGQADGHARTELVIIDLPARKVRARLLQPSSRWQKIDESPDGKRLLLLEWHARRLDNAGEPLPSIATAGLTAGVMVLDLVTGQAVANIPVSGPTSFYLRDLAWEIARTIRSGNPWARQRPPPPALLLH